MIKNYVCQSCFHKPVCKISSKIDVFSIEAKKPLGVDIQILRCVHYEGNGEVKDEEE